MKRNLEIWGVVATVVAVAGVWANNHRMIACFGLWIVSNGITLVLHRRQRMWSLAIRDLIFLALAMRGWQLWMQS